MEQKFCTKVGCRKEDNHGETGGGGGVHLNLNENTRLLHVYLGKISKLRSIKLKTQSKSVSPTTVREGVFVTTKHV